MRIIHVMSWYMPNMGYQENYLPVEQKNLGHEVEVLTSDRHAPFSNYAESVGRVLGSRVVAPGVSNDNGIKIHRLPPLVEVSSHGQIMLKGLKSKLRILNPDIVQAHGVITPSSIQSVIHQKSLGYPLFLDAHVCYFNLAPYCFYKKLYYRVFKYLFYPVFINRVKKIFAVSEDAKDVLVNELGISVNKIEIITLGANSQKFYFDTEHRRKIRHNLGIGDYEIIAIYAGKMTASKDIKFLINSSENLLKRFDYFRLLLVGNGPRDYLNEVKELVTEKKLNAKVIFHDFVKNEDLPKFYSAADIGIWPGDSSITIIEGMSCSLPIIIQQSKSSHHLVQNNGFSFQRGNESQFQTHLEELIKNDKLRKKMGNNSRKLVEKEFDWRQIAKKTIKYYNEALDKLQN